ncbi:fructuronate reductase [Sanguibacter gelidistatuariae]|uniref:Mannitol-1-phosphate 5-dehydrogenase n=1 Tax=Sanguibacter gelidistatuariae TaxID=1814289 RepID=A0A1G6XN80_9MICO|nr:mannitol dehydrogenase family protein [Sanguibacter gelidistatuariae]SDD79512.1 fructuronate reductase [Sanguibacter gelidistatuariae]
MSSALAVPLDRATFAARTGKPSAPAPVRIVHLGLGAFHRAHQAWFTDRVDVAHEWGIAAFTGRSPKAAEEIAQQDGLYSVLERAATSEQVSVVTSIVEAWDGARLDRLVPLLAASTTAIVTLTITEAGYRLTSDGAPDRDDHVMVEDMDRLRSALTGPGLVAPDFAGTAAGTQAPVSTLGRLVLGLEARRRADGGAISIVPCDNMPGNGEHVRAGILAIAQHARPETARWIEANVSFVSTSVDRITPATTSQDVALVAELSGWIDNAPVVCEPFADWVLSGDFPAGRPSWEDAGAKFVRDIDPFERRKLWLLNGAHSLLAYAGPLRGHATVAQAVVDPVCRAQVEALWDEAVRHLPAEGLDLQAYRRALLERFENGRIEHRLAQIAKEGVTKMRVRVAAVAVRERAAGQDAAACAWAIGAWVASLLAAQDAAGTGEPATLPDDAAVAAVRAALAGENPVTRLVALLDAGLAADEAFVARVSDAASSMG